MLNSDGQPGAGQIRVTWPDDLAGGHGTTACSPGRLWTFPAGDGVRRIPVREAAPPPVFILSVARSGSTLLRFILDSHPDLACPPETNVGQVCFGLARLWDLLEPSPESAKDGWRPHLVPDHIPGDATRAIRGAVDAIYGRYLARHGKRRWCDKSLDSAQLAGLLAHVYPGAQFICLYRHAMDVVVSAIEAAPWGLSGYGFDSYVAGAPGNTVLAAASCWLDQTTAIIDFQDKHPDRCHGIRYEDLVTAPEQVAGELLTFLGLTPVPGITQTCLQQDHDIRGPADHKIWFTSQISTASLGQGARVPVGMLPPEFLKNLNQTLDRLDYRQVDERWRAETLADPRAGTTQDAAPGQACDTAPGQAPDTTPGQARATTPSGPADPALAAAAAAIAARLGSVPDSRLRDLAHRWPDAAGWNLMIAVLPPDGTGPGHCWTVARKDSTLTIRPGQSRGDATATVQAPPATWQALLDGQANLATEQRAGRLRLLDGTTGPQPGEAIPLWAPMHLIARLLGLAGGRSRPDHNRPVTVPGPPDTSASLRKVNK